MTGREPVVAVEDLAFAYAPGGPWVLEGVEWGFADAAITALLGRNGSGKTTLLNLVLGWLEPTRGRVRVNGRERASTPRREWSREVGLVPQEEAPAFELELDEYVLLGRAPYLGLLEAPGPADLAVAEAAIERTGLAPHRRRAVAAMSGGERQLAAIARALAQDPHVLLLDEPLSHLDLGNTRRILGLLDALRREGRAVILTTHDPNVAAALADEAVLLKDGRVQTAGPAERVLTADHLGATFGVGVEVAVVNGRRVVLPAL